MSRLLNETSPYLQQHADNPVDWYPWGDEALDKAKAENKPILLSIGYSACHWCHVMAHESFEDEGTAAVMNELFVNVKVDREERPDLDKIYQTAHWMLTQRSGGWPLTMFLTPDQVPFFGGTYFPKQPRHGLPAFTDLLQRIAYFYREKRDDIGQQNESLLAGLAKVYDPAPHQAELSDQALDDARQQLKHQYDPQWGGFGRAPKFPHPSNLERLLRHWHHGKREDQEALDMFQHSLTRMAEGGLFDHLGGGFCRYSVDDYWMIPHFEKMLYDNGPLLALYAQAYAATGDALYRERADATADWVIREMQSPEGGFYSTLDADSEGEEGKFYVWTPETIDALLSEQQAAILRHRFGFDTQANFEGHWHLHAYHSEAHTAEHMGISLDELKGQWKAARDTLFQAREQRIHPGRDEKILTAWNGLMIRGLCIAGQHLQREDCIDAAERALDFIHRTLWVDGSLIATYKDGKAHLTAYLDDYAYLLDALLEFLQQRWRNDLMHWAVELADELLSRYQDSHHGGFFFTADNHEALIQRPKTFSDDAIPNGNAVAAFALARLGNLLGELRYTDAAEDTLLNAAGLLQEQPLAHCSLLHALEEYRYGPALWVVRGKTEELKAWQSAIAIHYQPRQLAFFIPNDAGNELHTGLADKQPADTGVRAYRCQDMSCASPINELDAFIAHFR